MEKTEILEVNIEEIVPNRFQPRLTFNQNELMDLAASIKNYGIIQPLVVRQLGDKYEIIAGERRYKASKIAGLKRIPIIVMNVSDEKSAEISIIENIQRKEMSSLEEAKSFKNLLDKGFLTQEQLAARLGKSQSFIANKMRLLNLTESVQEALLLNKISERHARSLLQVPNEYQPLLLNDIIEKRLTVKETDEMIEELYPKERKIKTLIDNSLFLETQEEKPKDILEIKEEAKDIFIEKKEKPNLDELLKTEEKEKNLENTNRFIFNIADEIENKKEKQTKVREIINTTIKTLRENNFKVNIEEFDYEKIHQFVIKIKKE